MAVGSAIILANVSLIVTFMAASGSSSATFWIVLIGTTYRMIPFRPVPTELTISRPCRIDIQFHGKFGNILNKDVWKKFKDLKS